MLLRVSTERCSGWRPIPLEVEPPLVWFDELLLPELWWRLVL